MTLLQCVYCNTDTAGNHSYDCPNNANTKALPKVMSTPITYIEKERCIMTDQDQVLKDQLDANKHAFTTRAGYGAELEKLYAMAFKLEDVNGALHLLDKIRAL